MDAEAIGPMKRPMKRKRKMKSMMPVI